jgi:hypothetical protein
MTTPDDAFADIYRLLRNRGIALTEEAQAELRGLFDVSIGGFIAVVIETKRRNVWTEPDFIKFPTFVLDIVTLAIEAEIRHIARDSDSPTSPVRPDVVNAAVKEVVRRAAIRDACEYHIEDIISKVGDLDRTKACGPLYVPRSQLVSSAARA